MARRIRAGKDFLPPGFSNADLKTAKWFLDAVAPRYHGVFHSHVPAIAVSDAKGGRTLTSLSALFHEEWPHVSLVDILTALARAGFITPPQQITDSATDAESGSYTFRLTGELGQFPPLALRSARVKLGAVRKGRRAGQSLRRKVG